MKITKMITKTLQTSTSYDDKGGVIVSVNVAFKT